MEALVLDLGKKSNNRPLRVENPRCSDDDQHNAHGSLVWTVGDLGYWVPEDDFYMCLRDVEKDSNGE